MKPASTFLRSGPRLGTILAIVRRDFHITRSYRAALVLDYFFGVINLLVYFFISRTFKGATTAELGGAPSYFAFAAVGIAVTVVIGAATSGISRRVREEQLTGTLEALIAQPIGTAELSLGLGGLPFLLSLPRAAFYIVVSGLLLGVNFSHASWGGFLVVLIATGTAMAALGVLAGALVIVFKRGEVITGVMVFGMALLGGAYFPPSVLPSWLSPLADLVPTRFAFSGLRAAVFDGTGWHQDALILLGFTLITLPLATLIFRAALEFARRSGSLAQY